MPVGHLGLVNDTTAFPAGWRVLAVPSNWDASDMQVHIRPVTIEYVTVPDDFFMTIQTAEMVKKDLATAIIVSFRASEDGVRIRNITGMGTDWLQYLAEVVAVFPPTAWEKHAVGLIVEFLRLVEVREAAAPVIAKLPRRGLDAPVSSHPLDVGVQRRRKITPEHLGEVAKIYAAAQASDDPPTRAVQHHFGVSHSTAAKWVGAARKAGLLPPLDSDE